MTFADYMLEVRRTESKESPRRRQMNYALGLVEEAGEVAGWHKKTVFHGRDLGKDLLIEELGDVAWYFVSLCRAHNINPLDVFQRNADKLNARYPEGFVKGGGNR